MLVYGQGRWYNRHCNLGDAIVMLEIREAPMSLSESEQSALIVRLQQGDTTAFDELYAAIEQGLNGYIRTLTLDEDEAQEIAQDTWRYFIEIGVQRYNPGAGRSPLSFIKVSARWAALNYFRKRAEWRRVERLLKEFKSRHPDIDHKALTFPLDALGWHWRGFPLRVR